MQLRVLTWNLMHGRSVPGSGRELLTEFGDALAGWAWDVALLQEVPPWWPALLATRLDAESRMVLTSRNSLLAMRRFVARRRPDAIKSNGGGANAILARSDRIAEHRAVRLCRLPERRWVHGVRLGSGLWAANLHGTAHDTAAARRDAWTARAVALSWARDGTEPLVLGGDFNLRELSLQGFDVVASRDVDHLCAGPGVGAVGAAEALDRGTLSDHLPLAATLAV